MKVESYVNQLNKSENKGSIKSRKQSITSQTEPPVVKSHTDATDWLSDLLTSYPDANIYVKTLLGAEGIRDFAAVHYGSLQIIISPEALKRMANDSDFKKQCEEAFKTTLKALEGKISGLVSDGKAILGKGLYLGDDGNVSQWVVSEKKEYKTEEFLPWKMTYTDSKTDNITDRFRTKDGKVFEIRKKLTYQPARDLARIAKAHNQQLVKTAMGGIRYSIYQLKNSSGDKNVSRQLAGQAEQVLRKAQLKVKLLVKEEYMKQSEKRAKERFDEEHAAFIRKQLRDHQVKRKVREYGQIKDYYPTPQEAQREKEYTREWIEQISGGALSESAYGLGAYLASPAIPSGGVALGGGTGAVIDIVL